MTLDEAQQQGIAPWDDEVERVQGVRIYRDRFPVTTGHLLFVPEANEPYLIAQCFQLAHLRGEWARAQGQYPAFNIGINVGTEAGQTVMYPHVHLIPRRAGDCRDPVGGVRGVIPGQANYRGGNYQRPPVPH